MQKQKSVMKVYETYDQRKAVRITFGYGRSCGIFKSRLQGYMKFGTDLVASQRKKDMRRIV